MKVSKMYGHVNLFSSIMLVQPYILLFSSRLVQRIFYFPSVHVRQPNCIFYFPSVRQYYHLIILLSLSALVQPNMLLSLCTLVQPYILLSFSMLVRPHILLSFSILTSTTLHFTFLQYISMTIYFTFLQYISMLIGPHISKNLLRVYRVCKNCEIIELWSHKVVESQSCSIVEPQSCRFHYLDCVIIESQSRGVVKL